MSLVFGSGIDCSYHFEFLVMKSRNFANHDFESPPSDNRQKEFERNRRCENSSFCVDAVGLILCKVLLYNSLWGFVSRVGYEGFPA